MKIKLVEISNRLRILIIPVLLASLPINTILNQDFGISNGMPASGRSSNENSQISTLEITDHSIKLQMTVAPPQFEKIQGDRKNCLEASIPGLLQSDFPDLPSLPVQGAMLGIPPDAQPTIQMLELEQINIPGKYDLCPAPRPLLPDSPNQPLEIDGLAYQRSTAYQQNAFMPSSIAEVAATGYLRSQRYAELRFNPLQYNPVAGEVRYFSRIVVQLDFHTNKEQADKLPFKDEGYFEDNLQNVLINYEQARTWRSQPPRQSLSRVASLPDQPFYKILVEVDGIYQISYSDLQAAGVPLSELDNLDPSTFQLFNQSLEAAIYVQGQENGLFEPGEYLLFYGQKVDTKYTETNVYWLTWGGALGRRMEPLDGALTGSGSVPVDFLTTFHAELDTQYYRGEPSGADSDHWYWEMINANYNPPHNVPPYEADFTFDLKQLSPSDHSIVVHGLLEGFYADTFHHTLIYLNGHLVDDHIFPANAEYAFSANIPQSYLLDSANTLTVECPLDMGGTMEYVLFNWFEIEYFDAYFAEDDRLFFDGEQAGILEFQVDGFSNAAIEAFDITDPLTPLYITGQTVQQTADVYQLAFESEISEEHHYLAQVTTQRMAPLSIHLDNPSSWKSQANGADYIIISHADFLSAVQPLVNHRSNQYRVQVVDVQDLYDEFNGGVFSPDAIRSFLEYAYDQWIPPAPSYVLLVGDGHFDYKNIYGWNETNFIPPYMDDVDPWIGETATDNRYASVSGSDILPDMYIGRFPARTAAEALTMVDKTITYEQIPPSGGWNTNMTFIADNADGSGDFPAQSDLIISTYLPPGYSVDKVYYLVNYATTSTARAAVQSAINAGRLILHYDGHGSTQQWAVEGLLKVSDIPSLSNGNKLPFFLPMTCGEGYFVWPSPAGKDHSSLGESIVRYSGGGAIASWSPTGYGITSGHAILDDSLFKNLFIKHQTQLGFLTTQAKYDLYAKSADFTDMIETYLLFGDPALKLQKPEYVYLPLAIR